MRLVDFQNKLREQWEQAQKWGANLPEFSMTLCEVAVLRMYSECREPQLR